VKKKDLITLTLVIFLILTACFVIINKFYLGAVILVFFGVSLFLIGLSKNRTTVLIFGHACIVVGCMMVTWGIYLIPHSKPDLLQIFIRPYSGDYFLFLVKYAPIIMDSVNVS
jgi:hypothetical protein